MLTQDARRATQKRAKLTHSMTSSAGISDPKSARISAAAKLRELLDGPGVLTFPCCYDALSAKLIAQAGFPMAFMSGFGVAAVRLGLPDTGLISYGEMVDQARNICAATSIPIIGDGDTGYGNAVNVKRTVKGYAGAGLAGVMIEDQVAPKRCGHTRGKAVVDRHEATARIQAAVDARHEGADILILARTDALGTHGLDEALWRASAFSEIGADMLFVEAPTSEQQMREICQAVPGHHMANMLEDGLTPLLPDQTLQEIGYKLIAHPFAALEASVSAMKDALRTLRRGEIPKRRISFEELRSVVGFDEYCDEEERYRSKS